MNILNLSYDLIRQSLIRKDFSVSELVGEYIKVAEKNSRLNLFVTKTFEKAIDEAKIADKNIKDGNIRRLEGAVMGIKDVFCTKNVRTTCSSKILENFVPKYESTVTQKLFDEGMISLGKLSMDEFAMGSTNKNSAFGNVINPYKGKNEEDLVPGGSSGASAAAVAAGVCVATTGSDTGGSIRQPASFCGIVGVKPTYGRCSRYGMIAFASSLDQAGILAKNVDDAALFLDVISGYDAKDSTSVKTDKPICDWNGIKGLKVGIVKELMDLKGFAANRMERGIKFLEEAGAEIVEVSIPNIHYSIQVYYLIACAEASSNLARYDGVRYGHRTKENFSSIDEMYELSRSEGFGKEVARRILVGTFVLSSDKYDEYYKRAQQVRGLITKDFVKAFEKVDAIISMSTAGVAYPIDAKLSLTEEYMNDALVCPANLAGLPGISVPIGISEDGLPIGIQVIGKHFDEATMFNVAKQLEISYGNGRI